MLVFKNFRIVDEAADFSGSLVIENGIIKNIFRGAAEFSDADIVIDGGKFPPSAALMPAFIDLHAHFRDPGFPEKENSLPSEVLESASLAAAAGGFTTAVCMANTKPVTDTLEQAVAVKSRADALGLIDLYPVISLTKNMDGRELSGIKDIRGENKILRLPLMLSEDGKDIADEGLFLAAMKEAKRLGIPVSCHCDFSGPQNAEKARGGRTEWSRSDENFATRRAIELGKKAGCHIHIAHVSTKEAAEIILSEKNNLSAGFTLTCEATPHHIGATEEDARRMGDESYGRVNPPLRAEADRLALIAALNDGTIDAIATDHAPHSEADKAAGSPGFTGLETAFAACHSHLADIGLRRLSALMSANPARILGLHDRGRIAEGLRADLVIVDTEATWKVAPDKFKSRGKCSPFAGKELRGKVVAIHPFLSAQSGF